MNSQCDHNEIAMDPSRTAARDGTERDGIGRDGTGRDGRDSGRTAEEELDICSPPPPAPDGTSPRARTASRRDRGTNMEYDFPIFGTDSHPQPPIYIYIYIYMYIYKSKHCTEGHLVYSM
jgi:hypothetical protein